MTERDDGTTLAVQGALNYLTLLDIEHDLSLAAGRDLPVLLDLRQGIPVDDQFAWSITEVIRVIEDADVTVLVGSDATMHELSKVCTLEGAKSKPRRRRIENPRRKRSRPTRGIMQLLRDQRGLSVARTRA